MTLGCCESVKDSCRPLSSPWAPGLYDGLFSFFTYKCRNSLFCYILVWHGDADPGIG